MSSWQEYARLENGEIFILAFGDYPERKLGETKGDDEKSITYFVDRYSIIETRVNKFLSKIVETDNKGSFLSGLVSLKDKTAHFSAIGDLHSLVKKIQEQEVLIEKEVEANKEKNKSIKEKLLLDLLALKDSSDWLTTTPRIKEIQQSWMKLGKTTAQEEEEMQLQYKEAIDSYFSRKRTFDADRKEMELANQKAYQAIIEKAKQILSAEKPIIKAQIDGLHQEWKTVGRVPKKQSQALWTSFKECSDALFVKLNAQPKKKAGQQKNTLKPIAVDYTKEDLEHKLSEIEQLDQKQAIILIKELKSKWKQANFKEDDKQEGALSFFQQIDMLLEKRFLLEQTKKRNQNFDALSEDEKKDALVKQLRKFIRKDKEAISTYSNNAASIGERTNASWEKLVQQKVNAQERKLQAKEYLLKSLQ